MRKQGNEHFVSGTPPSNLHPGHLQHLRKESGLLDEIIHQAQAYSVRPGDINKILGSGLGVKVNSLLAFPYPDNELIRYKLFPPVPDKDGHLIRYYQPKGSPNHLYIPERVKPILSDPSVPLYLTEGEKKTLKACQEGLYCIGLGGLWNWSRGDEERTLISDFDLIEWKGRAVYIIPDNDWLNPNRHGERRNLREAVYELAYRLIDRGAKVFIIELPMGPEKGLDDYLCNHTVDEFQALPKREIRKLTLQKMIKQATLETLPEILKRLSNLKETERAIHINTLAKKLKVRKSVIEKDLTKLTTHGEPDIDRLLEGGANPESHYSAQNFIDGVLSFGAILGKERVLVRSDGEIILANGSDGDSFRFKRSALTAEAIKRFRTGEEIDGRDLLNRIQTLFSDHVIFKNCLTPILLAVWVLGTYFFKVFQYYGYLWVNSPVKRCGKSLLLDLFALVCFNATSRLVDPSPSFLFREVDRNDGTLVLDEIESLGSADKEQKSQLISLLNAGFQRGSQAPRMELKNREYEVTYFNAYCPKVLAGIKNIVDTIEDRAFKISMVRKKKSEIVKRFNLRAVNSAIEKLKEDCFLWALRYVGDVVEVYGQDEEFPGDELLDDRLKDILEPLLSLASVVDAQAGDNTMPTVHSLLAVAKDMVGGREAAEILNSAIPAAISIMKGMVNGIDERFIPAEELFSKFLLDDDLSYLQSKRAMAFFLSKLEIHRDKPRRIGDKAGVRGYLLKSEQLEDLERRYS